jgi:outer membrane protein assembly factor BamB
MRSKVSKGLRRLRRRPAGKAAARGRSATATRARRGWIGRGVLACVLLAAIFLPGQASGAPVPRCRSVQCKSAGMVRWIRPLPGSWSAQDAVLGTVPAASSDGGVDNSASSGGTQPGEQAYAAVDRTVAVIGVGLTVYAYDARNGHPLWTATLTGFPANAAIVSLRVWPGVVTAGVADGPLATNPPQAAVVLAADGGQQLQTYRAASFGGAVGADARHTVVVGPVAVTSYATATGRVIWSRPIGQAGQDWRTDGGHLYVAKQAGGDLSTGPVTALRRISLSSGVEQVIRPPGGSFDGKLSAVLRDVVLFSSAQGVTAYSGTTGRLLWRLAGAVPESADVVRGLFYLNVGSTLTGVQPSTGRIITKVTGASGSGSSGVLGVRGGVALGLDQGPLGDVWGYDVAGQRVIWTTKRLAWPHYFVDLSGIGGSADPGNSTVIITACGQQIQVGTGKICQAPELVAIDR